jgi:hypothetical protein
MPRLARRVDHRRPRECRRYIRHEIVDAGVPLQRRLRIQIVNGGDGVTDASHAHIAANCPNPAVSVPSIEAADRPNRPVMQVCMRWPISCCSIRLTHLQRRCWADNWRSASVRWSGFCSRSETCRIRQSERIRRIRRRQPAGGMEYVVDVLDLADGADQHREADASNGDEVKELI